MTKGGAFVVGMIFIMVIFFVMAAIVLFKDAELGIIPYAACLTAVCAVVTAYIGGNVADNKFKGENWNQEMFDSYNRVNELNSFIEEGKNELATK